MQCITHISEIALQNYFGPQYPLHGRTLSVWLGWSGSYEPPGKVQMHNRPQINVRNVEKVN